MKSKPFIVANVRDILDQYDREEISFSRMTEMFNEVAFKWADEARRDAVAEKDKLILGYENQVIMASSIIEEKDRIIAEQKLALNEAEKKIKQLDTKPY